MSDESNETGSGAPHDAGGPLRFVVSRLASPKFALVVVAAITLACIAGTLIPQGDQVTGYLARHPDAHRFMQVLSTLGLTRVYSAWWFVALLVALAASLVVCTVRRGSAIRRTTGAARARVLGSFVTHVSLLLVLAGGAVRVSWGQRGMLALYEGEMINQVTSRDGGFLLPFSVRLVKFELEFHDQRAAADPHAQSPIKSFKSTLDVLEGGQVILTRTMAVNSPLSHRGYTFYQSSYNPRDLRWSLLQVVRDPSVPIVYAGFALMIVGLTIVFGVGPWLDTRGRTTKGVS